MKTEKQPVASADVALTGRPVFDQLSPQRQALLARRLRQAGEAEAKPVIPAAPRRGDSDSFPLSFAQQRFWFLDQLEPGSPFYNEHFTFRLRGVLSTSALQSALTQVIRRHEVLRTSFTTVDGRPRQIVSPPFEMQLPFQDLSALADSDREAEALRLAREESNRPFDLTQPPLIRARLFRLSPTEHVLALVIHHIASDGWSGTLLARELPALYASVGSPLPDLPIQYADYALWQRETWATGGNIEALLAYWKRQLEGAPHVLELPTDRPRPPVQTHRGAIRHFTLSAELAQAIRELSQREGATAFMVLLAAFNALLQRYTGQEDILIGSPIAGRNFKEVEGVIGCFLNTLVFRTHLDGDPAFRELIRRVRATALGAYAHQELPFEQLVDELHLVRDMSRNPLFQVMFVFQVSPAFPYALPGFVMEFVDLPGGTTKFDLMLTLTDIGDVMLGGIEYSTDLFDAVTIERWVNHWQTLLAGAVADPDQPLSALPLLTESERRLITGWNATRREFRDLGALDGDPRRPKLPGMLPAQVECVSATIALSVNDNHPLSPRIPDEVKMSANPPEQAKSSKTQQIAGQLQDPEQIQQQIQAQKAERPGIQAAFVAPQTPIEIKLAAIWAEVLGLEQVGLHDDFFELGGHSLLATQVLSRISQEFGQEVPMEFIFAGTFTIAELSKAIAQLQIEQADPQNLETLLEKLSQLSEEEARQLLARQAEGR